MQSAEWYKRDKTCLDKMACIYADASVTHPCETLQTHYACHIYIHMTYEHKQHKSNKNTGQFSDYQ